LNLTNSRRRIQPDIALFFPFWDFHFLSVTDSAATASLLVVLTSLGDEGPHV
jgi:hypothetical protein